MNKVLQNITEAGIHALIENSEDAVWILSIDRSLVLANSGYNRFCELVFGKTVKIGEKPYEILPIATDPKVLHSYQKALNGELSKVSFEFKINNRIRTYEITVGPILNDEESIVGITCQARDITDKKTVESLITQSEYKYRKLIDTMSEGLLYVDNNDRIQFGNDRFFELLGYSRDELKGIRAYEELLTDEGKQIIFDKYNNFRLKGISDSYELSLRKKNGDLISVLVNASPLYNEKSEIIGSMATISDVSDLKRSEGNLIALIENTDDRIWSIDDHYNLLVFNNAFRKHFENKFNKVPGIGKNILKLLPEPHLDNWKRYYNKALEGKHFAVELSEIYENKKIHTLVSFNPIVTNHRISGVSVFSKDISLQKEKELELIKAKEMAEMGRKAQEIFLANISHEIRTPLNAIHGMSLLLENTSLAENQKEFLNAIRLSSDNLLVIINDILDISKIESGKMTFERTNFNLPALLSSIEKTVRYKVQEKKLQFILDIDKAIPEDLLGDPVRLNQILLNLVSNAVKFTNKGQVLVQAKSIESDQHNCRIEFRIKDTGIGIPENKLSVIFDMFMQANNDTARKYGGTGLGLSIAKQLVELQGGHIKAESAEGIGSEFCFSLEFEKSKAVNVISETGKYHKYTDTDLSDKNILLVEDNAFNQLLAKNLIHSWKGNIDIAENGRVALDILKEKDNYDIILMDIQMPELDGYETTHYIRNKMSGSVSNVPILAVTAHAGSSDQKKCLEMGANDYITKPINPDQLLHKILTLLDSNSGQTDSLKFNEMNNSEYQHLDLNYLRSISMGDKNFMIEMISIFIEQTPDMMEKMITAANEKDWNTLRAIIHQLKPNISYIGIKENESLIITIQDKVKGLFDLEAVPELLLEFKTKTLLGIEELKVELERLQKS